MNDMLVAIGEALIDFIPDKTGCGFGEVEAFSPKIGGAPANVCGAFSRLGGRARLLTQLGDDPFGHKILRELEGCGIDVSCVSLTDEANTALAFVSLGADGGRTFSFYRKPSADMLYSPESVREEYFDDAFVLHFCSVSLGDFPMKEAHRAAIEQAGKRRVLVSFDPNLRFPLWKDRDALKRTVNEFLSYANILKISDEELEFITGETDINKALGKLKPLWGKDLKLMLYTCGSGGAYAFTGNDSAYSAGIKVNAVDTTGAGDGFIGAFLWKLKELGLKTPEAVGRMTEDEMKQCLDFANGFCARSVQRKGAIASYPTLEEMNTAPQDV